MNLEEDEESFGFEDASPGSSAVNLSINMPNPNAAKANKQKTKSLETLLMSKNRKLQDDLTTLRVVHDELLTSSRKNALEAEKLKQELKETRKLNDKLENDLLNIQMSSSRPRVNGIHDNSSHSSNRQARSDTLESLTLGLKQETGALGTQNHGPIPNQDPLGKSATNNSSSTSDMKLSAESSILPIITSQRDRFRQRNSELEEELRKQFEIITSTRHEIKGLQSDNLKLYEKVRYLQSYRDDSSSASMITGPSGSRINSSSLPSAVSRKDEELSKYRGIYEEHMNPFEKFRGRVSEHLLVKGSSRPLFLTCPPTPFLLHQERMGALKALNPLDKLVLHAANFVLGNRLARNFFLVYAIVLHALLFMSYSETALS